MSLISFSLAKIFIKINLLLFWIIFVLAKRSYCMLKQQYWLLKQE